MQDISWINTLDMAGFTFFGSMQSSFLTGMARLFSFDGIIFYVAGISAMIALCCIRRTRKIGVAMVFAFLLGVLLCNGLVKPLVQRPRPYVTLAENAAYIKWHIGAGSLFTDSVFSFPSGHASEITALMTVLFIAHIRSARKAAKAVAWIFLLVAVISSCSRIYLMIHYTTDVIAGFLIGILAGICAYFLVHRYWDGLLQKMKHRRGISDTGRS